MGLSSLNNPGKEQMVLIMLIRQTVSIGSSGQHHICLDTYAKLSKGLRVWGGPVPLQRGRKLQSRSPTPTEKLAQKKLECECSSGIICLLFCAWLISFSIMSSRSIYVVECVRISFLSKAEEYFVVWICIHSSTDRHLGYFLLLVNVNNTAINIGTRIFILAFTSFAYMAAFYLFGFVGMQHTHSLTYAATSCSSSSPLI